MRGLWRDLYPSRLTASPTGPAIAQLASPTQPEKFMPAPEHSSAKNGVASPRAPTVCAWIGYALISEPGAVVTQFLRSLPNGDPLNTLRAGPFNRGELTRNIAIAHLGLFVPARQANCSHLRQSALSRNLVFARSKCSGNDRPIAVFTGIRGDVKVLCFHDEIFPSGE